MAAFAPVATRPALPGRLRAALPAWLTAHPDLSLLLVVVLVGGLVRAAFLLRAPVFIIPDSEDYFLPGFQLARGLGFTLEPRRTPLYPAFIAGVVAWIGQDLAALALAQHLLGLTSIGLTYALGRVTFGHPAAFLAALLVALNGSLLIAEHTVTTEALFIALLTAAAVVGALALSAARARVGEWESAFSPFPTLPLSLVAGLLLGLAALSRPAGLALLPGFPLALLAARAGWRRYLQIGGLYLVGVGVVLLPWMVRNYVTLRVFSTEGALGQTLVGRTVRHDRFAFVDPAAPDPDPRRRRARELMQETANRPNPVLTPLRRRLTQELGLTELQANQLMRDLAVDAILRQPGYYAVGTASFFVRLAVGWPDRLRDAWQSRRDADARQEWEAYPEIAGLLGPPSALEERQFARAEQGVSLFQPGRVGVPLLALFLIGVLGSLLGPPAWRPALLPAVWAIALLLVAAAFVGPLLRYRYPAEPFLAVLAAGGVSALWRWGLRAARRAPAPPRSAAAPSAR